MKKFLKVTGIILLALILAAGVYVISVFASYHRIEDNLKLEPEVLGNTDGGKVAKNTTYSIMTYNVGYGAYSRDYSFFMDGGESSWAKSEPALRENLEGISKEINSAAPNFLLLQEVDSDGTRSYHVNEVDILKEKIGNGAFVFASNYDSPFLMYPLTEPIGANKSGILTKSSFGTVSSAVRRSLPVSDSVKKILDLDRCYSITRIPAEGDKELCLYNVHLSAYGAERSVREGQLGMLMSDVKTDKDKGNYVIIGGDFNHNLRSEGSDKVPEWAQLFPREALPQGFNMGFDKCENADISHDTCRNTDTGFVPGTSFTVMADGFMVSDNVKVTDYVNVYTDFMYSDHTPVLMSFELD